MAVLERLTHRVQCVPGELQHLVEKEHAQVRKRDLARSRWGAAADEARRGDRVMRRAKWPQRRWRALRLE